MYFRELSLIAVVLLGLLTPPVATPKDNASPLDTVAMTLSIAPPEQPVTGPGGTTYPFARVETERIGSRATGVTVFQPDAIDRAMLDDLPVIVFLHGFTAVEPRRYGGWIEHLVRRGAVVLYPDYQDAGLFAGGQNRYIDNMFAGVTIALHHLELDPARVHVVGHSLGAVLTVVYGTLSPERGLPPAASLTLIEPGGCRTCGNAIGFGVPVQLDRQIPKETLVSIVVGDDDTLAGISDAIVLSGMIGTIPAERRRFVVVRGDDHGQPPLIADHLFPQTGGTGGEEDALDWYGLWRPFDALITCADTGHACDIALGTSEAALSMGSWSDGTPVVRPQVLDTTNSG